MKFNQLLTAIFSFTALSVVMQPPTPAFAQSTCACVTSEPRPQSGQRNRSSGNFSTQGCSSSLRWSSPPGITYDIKQDRSRRSDPTRLFGLTNGVRTGNPNERSLYIANPRNASSNFRVCAINR
jgi:hypothetical protein